MCWNSSNELSSSLEEIDDIMYDCYEENLMDTLNTTVEICLVKDFY